MDTIEEKVNNYLHEQRKIVENNLYSEVEEVRLMSMGKYNTYTEVIRFLKNGGDKT